MPIASAEPASGRETVVVPSYEDERPYARALATSAGAVPRRSGPLPARARRRGAEDADRAIDSGGRAALARRAPALPAGALRADVLRGRAAGRLPRT